ncbi:MAG: hypothetical protein EOP62_15080 [Sphingomonadales bacterium]|nr:MAG: hypothetical protein EOP62_15080 [Sphingomonadales bacterium]
MIDHHIISELQINPNYLDLLQDQFKRFKLNTNVRILVVVDTEIATVPGVGFGVGSVIELIRASAVGCMHFTVDIALRSNSPPAVVASPAAYGAKYTGFRFDMTDGANLVIDKYQQIWIFGFKPDNSAGPDSRIDLPTSLPASNGELAKLAGWMKAHKGGVFATGDHDYLGASICHRIPRIGTMRRWTNADGVPPIGGFGDSDTADRIDTLRPPNAAYEPGAPGGPLALNNSPHQGDLTPQPIHWVTWQSVGTGILSYKHRPHPVLCHPTLGPINVMPDHAHEGLCRDTGTVPLTGTYNFDGAGAQDEYPPATGGGAKPEPTIIAYGSNLGGGPYNFAKGPQPARNHNPMISVYDGHLAGVGRVATDSTWHHWFDVNIADIQAENGANWAKISRYFINLAVWLSPPGYSTTCLWWCTVLSHFTATGFQEYSPKLSDVELGQALSRQLYRIYGPCWVSHVIWDRLRELKLSLIEKPHLPIPPACLTCPPYELIELSALGGLVRATLPLAEAISQATARFDKTVRLDASMEKTLSEGLRGGVQSVARQWREDLAKSAKRIELLAR